LSKSKVPSTKKYTTFKTKRDVFQFSMKSCRDKAIILCKFPHPNIVGFCMVFAQQSLYITNLVVVSYTAWIWLVVQNVGWIVRRSHCGACFHVLWECSVGLVLGWGLTYSKKIVLSISMYPLIVFFFEHMVTTCGIVTQHIN